MCAACDLMHSQSHADQSSFLTPEVLKDCMLKIQHISCTHNWWGNSLIWFNWLSDSTNSFLIWKSQTIAWHQGANITTSNQHYLYTRLKTIKLGGIYFIFISNKCFYKNNYLNFTSWCENLIWFIDWLAFHQLMNSLHSLTNPSNETSSVKKPK